MLVKYSFNIDQIVLKHTPDKEGLVAHHLKKHAAEFGIELTKQFPFVKNEELSFAGELPEISMNKDHQFVDRYDLELTVLTPHERNQLLHLLVIHNVVKPEYL